MGPHAPQCSAYDCNHTPKDSHGHCNHTACGNSRNGCPVHARGGVER